MFGKNSLINPVRRVSSGIPSNWKALLTEMTDDVDLEDLRHKVIRGIDDGLWLSNAGVIDQNTWVSPLRS